MNACHWWRVQYRPDPVKRFNPEKTKTSFSKYILSAHELCMGKTQCKRLGSGAGPRRRGSATRGRVPWWGSRRCHGASLSPSPPEEGMAARPGVLAWRIPRILTVDSQSTVSWRVGHDWSGLAQIPISQRGNWGFEKWHLSRAIVKLVLEIFSGDLRRASFFLTSYLSEIRFSSSVSIKQHIARKRIKRQVWEPLPAVKEICKNV